MRTWLTAEKLYEGFPLMLRRPAQFDVESLRPGLSTLATVTHTFTKRQANGLPEPEYNHGLASMDCELVAAFDVDRMGVPVLIETFGGERNYYFYVAADADVAVTISGIASRYPHEQISWSASPDPDWDFIQRYAREQF
jgi:hypothetical protein